MILREDPIAVGQMFRTSDTGVNAEGSSSGVMASNVEVRIHIIWIVVENGLLRIIDRVTG